jgi:hypothetical protein
LTLSWCSWQQAFASEWQARTYHRGAPVERDLGGPRLRPTPFRKAGIGSDASIDRARFGPEGRLGDERNRGDCEFESCFLQQRVRSEPASLCTFARTASYRLLRVGAPIRAGCTWPSPPRVPLGRLGVLGHLVFSADRRTFCLRHFVDPNKSARSAGLLWIWLFPILLLLLLTGRAGASPSRTLSFRRCHPPTSSMGYA